MINSKTEISSDQSFCYVLCVELVHFYCFFCMKKFKTKSLLCQECKFARFCDENCKIACNRHFQHDTFECQLLLQNFPIVPSTLSLFFCRMIRKLKINGTTIEQDDRLWNGPESRNYANLIAHRDKILSNAEFLSACESCYEDTLKFLRGRHAITRPEFQTMFCKKLINSHGIFDNFGGKLGDCLDFALSAYDHSCRPNLGVVFDGVRTIFRVLDPNLDVAETRGVFVSYTELLQSRSKRRKNLAEKYFFDCSCERCLDPADDLLVSLKCETESCPGPVPLREGTPTESEFSVAPGCFLCHRRISREKCEKARQLMADIETLTLGEMGGGSEFYEAKNLLRSAEKTLHPMNVVFADLCTFYVQKSIEKKTDFCSALKFGQLCMGCLRYCYPSKHKSLAIHLLKLAYILLLSKSLENAKLEMLAYVEESYEIFKIWFGPEHKFTENLQNLLKALKHYNEEPYINKQAMLAYFGLDKI